MLILPPTSLVALVLLEQEFLEEVADIGKDAVTEALKIATEEGHVEAPKDI